MRSLLRLNNSKLTTYKSSRVAYRYRIKMATLSSMPLEVKIMIAELLDRTSLYWFATVSKGINVAAEIPMHETVTFNCRPVHSFVEKLLDRPELRVHTKTLYLRLQGDRMPTSITYEPMRKDLLRPTKPRPQSSGERSSILKKKYIAHVNSIIQEQGWEDKGEMWLSGLKKSKPLAMAGLLLCLLPNLRRLSFRYNPGMDLFLAYFASPHKEDWKIDTCMTEYVGAKLTALEHLQIYPQNELVMWMPFHALKTLETEPMKLRDTYKCESLEKLVVRYLQTDDYSRIGNNRCIPGVFQQFGCFRIRALQLLLIRDLCLPVTRQLPQSFTFAFLAENLLPVSKTLEELTVDIAPYEKAWNPSFSQAENYANRPDYASCYPTPVETLHHLGKLRKLSAIHHFLISKHYGKARKPRKAPSRVYPPTIEVITLLYPKKRAVHWLHDIFGDRKNLPALRLIKLVCNPELGLPASKFDPLKHRVIGQLMRAGIRVVITEQAVEKPPEVQRGATWYPVKLLPKFNPPAKGTFGEGARKLYTSPPTPTWWMEFDPWFGCLEAEL